jgi:hypothetical protein
LTWVKRRVEVRAIRRGSERTRASWRVLLDVLFKLFRSEYAESWVKAFGVEHVSHLLNTVARDRADPMFVAFAPSRGLFMLGSVDKASAILGLTRPFE